MQAGKTYSFQLSFTNPLYDPIQVRLHVQRSVPPSSSHHANTAEGGSPEKARRPPFAVTLPSSAFPIAAYAEAWEYEDDEEMFGVDEDDFDGGVRSGGAGGRDHGRGRTKTIGILERRANVTVIGGEVAISKEARGNVKVLLPPVSATCTQINGIRLCAVQYARQLHLPLGRSRSG